MRLLQIIVLFVCCFYSTATRAKPVKGISDFDGSFKSVERIDFECPPGDKTITIKSYEDLEIQEIKKSCWVDFHPTYLNVMNKQVINRNDVIRFFQSTPSSGKCCASWNLIYRDDEGNTRMLSMRRNDLPFPLTKRKLKRLGTPANIINRWLVQESTIKAKE
tara:strand:- start:20 stop:505 length:486 start_codon:yes stop_codon:yes gene_type:complete